MDKDQWMEAIVDKQATYSSYTAGFAADRASIKAAGKRKQSPWEDKANQGRVMQRHWLNTMDMTAALQQMTGQETIQFRGVQTLVLQAIQDSKSPVVAVMPTGGGKSMLFILPTFAEPSRTTIVVMPLLALHSDIARQCQALVMPESAVTDNFHMFIN
ncbi:uncharacterized protein BDW43DRAFT_317346 [Aspergillus alliaceus]|uniref:uncharacterized protein n=1 Tax=Petromyces alliaceus TaxID=209559 RepID=UPI0012A5F29F|nr:uncharacterized protein BDW43DRAFT_317346 [Aspergillus alliaceus]KAB8226894.1 hypothetical protein BDW43DRAFT_317346 [Aspergillus alliaceus]